MTLEDLGNIGEFVGAVAVVVSLLYLAVQIRQNSRLLRSAASQAAASLMLGLLEPPGYASWWESWKHVFGPEFREYVEDQLPSASSVSVPI